MVRADKWRSLVEAASRLFYQQGFEHTSLADIAAAAEVPLGNVYYYFKAREELLRACSRSASLPCGRSAPNWKSYPTRANVCWPSSPVSKRAPRRAPLSAAPWAAFARK
jgi:hypothetical protein